MASQSNVSGFSPSLYAGKVVLVTGAGSQFGIGRSIVLAAARAGAAVVCATDLNAGNFDALKAAAQEANPNTHVEGFVLDAASEEETLTLVKKVIREHGRLDVYFANAGLADVRNINDVTSAQVNIMLDVMTKSVFYAVKHGGAAMRVTSEQKTTPGGAIVVTASVAGMNGKFADLPYCTAKAAAIGMIRSASVQLSKSSIRINAVSPGFVASSLLTSSVHAQKRQKVNLAGSEEQAKKDYLAYLTQQGVGSAAGYYFQRIPMPEEMANVAIFLGSDLAAPINGQSVAADSGLTEGAGAHECLGGIPELRPLGLD